MTITASILADSINAYGNRLTTFQLRYPRFIHAEVLTHRVMARNSSSSRAIPVKRFIQMIEQDIATPVHWGKNQPGMQAKAELDPEFKAEVQALWEEAAHEALRIAERMSALGAHKQIVNRILEPFQHIGVVLTATEFDNFFELRAHPDAQPEIQALANAMKYAMENSTPVKMAAGAWHLPYVSAEEVSEFGLEIAKKVSAARCCRVSYWKHDGSKSSIDEDLALCEQLAGARPFHASPFEHQATPMGSQADFPYQGNFRGWVQYRKVIEEQLFG